MSHTSFIFTDAIKDVIGNDPVLDEYDISYEASFYGTTQDSFITGTMLNQVTYVSPLFNRTSTRKTVTFTTGSRPRGKLFSVYYSNAQAPLSSDFNSIDVSQVPALSYRAMPWNRRISSTSYRIQQCFDSSERYYDSCLPDLKSCFDVNGAKVWTTNNDPQFWLSPYGNVATSSIGYMFFNAPKSDRSAYGFSSDPMVNNEWTWSYPYENKYSPEKRLVKTNNALGLNSSYLSLTWDNSLVTNLTQSAKPASISGFLPFLPGRMDSKLIAPYGGRNSYRASYVTTGSFGVSTGIPGGIDDPRFDENFGVSYLIPSDVNLGQLASHSYLDAYPAIVKPAPAPVTGTMSLNDTVKFLFGFGDLNNMTWSKRLFVAASGSTTTGSIQTFETFGLSPPTAHGIPLYSNDFLQIDWSSSPANTPTARAWYVSSRAHADANKYQDVFAILSNSTTASSEHVNYNYTDGSYPITASSTKANQYGLFWLSSSLPSNTYALISDTYTSQGGTLPETGLFNYSYAVADITSSYPWALRYKRAIASHSTDFLWVYFAGLPGIPSQDLGGISPLSTVEILTGSGTGTNKLNIGLLQQYDSRQQGFGNSNVTGSISYPGWDYPLSPGTYRLVFLYWTTNTSAGGVIGFPSRCAVDDLEVFQYPSGSFPPDTEATKFGANNYPYFQTYRVDTRYNPIASPFSGITAATAYPYQGDIFGVSPVIRGWKYGLYSGLPMNSKAVFRRGRFGQFRDMLEQRQYTKFISVGTSPTDNDAIVVNGFDKDNFSLLGKTKNAERIGPSVVDVNFVKQRYKKDDRGIGYIFNEKVDPSLTYSQNLSLEATSSLPYFDGVARLRQETDLDTIKDVTTVAVSLGTNGLTVT
jgi:hypothetical protein